MTDPGVARGRRWRLLLGVASGSLAVLILAWDRLGFGTPGLHLEQVLVAVLGALVSLACLLGRRTTTLYRKSAVLAANAVVLFLLVNLVLGVVYEVSDHLPKPDPVSQKYPDVSLRDVYPDLDDREIFELLRVWSNPFEYEPYTQFRMRPYRSRFVNIDAAGFRLSADQAPWPPPGGAYTIFVFGGSTTFCYGLPDDQTVVSRIQERLRREGHPVSVYNFGRGLYYSTQELILFERLLLAGYRPDLAIFIDGLNDFRKDDQPSFSPSLSAYMRGERPRPPVLEGWPIRRLADQLAPSRSPGPALPPAPEEGSASLVEAVLDRYQRNVGLARQVGRAFGVETIFVWQPVPMYGYDLDHHLFASGMGDADLVRAGYETLAARLASHAPAERLVWCADIQRGLEKPLYVDAVHYGPELAARLADCVFEGLRGLDLRPRSPSAP